MQKRFLQKVGALDTANGKKTAKKLTTIEKTKQLLDQGQSLREIADDRGVNTETIISHLEKIKEQDPSVQLQYLGQDLMVARTKKIREALKKGGMTNGQYLLGPAKNLLGASFSYEEIRLVRLLM